MINKQALTNHFITVAEAAVGSYLSKLPDGTTPSVIKARGRGTIPDTPYIMVDVIASVNRTPNGNGDYINVGNNTVYTRLTDYLISYRCFGGDADEIINKLNTYFDIASVRDDVRSVTNGAVRFINDPLSLPQRLATEYQESSSFSLVWGGLDETVDVTSTLLTTPTLDATFTSK